MGDKPTAAFVLSLIGGVFVLLGAIVYFFVGSFFAVLLSMMANNGAIAASGGILAVAGLILAVVLIIASVLAYVDPEKNKLWGGIVIIVCSVLSWAFALVGFLVGFILALIGGILFLTWKPTTPSTATQRHNR